MLTVKVYNIPFNFSALFLYGGLKNGVKELLEMMVFAYNMTELIYKEYLTIA